MPAPTERVTCPAATTTVDDAEGLQAALDAARPGSVVEVVPGVYAGLDSPFSVDFEATSGL